MLTGQSLSCPRRLPWVAATCVGAGILSLGQPSPVEAQTRKPAAPTATVAAGWKVRADPPALPGSLPANVKPAMDVPGGTGVLYATTPGPFVALGSNEESTGLRQVIDLRNGEVLGSIRGKVEFSDKVRLSPDGQYLLDEGKGSNDNARGVQVWSFKTGQLAQRIDVSDHPAFIYLMDFAGPGRVVTTLSHGSGRVDVWDIAMGKKILGIPGSGTFGHDAAAFSPGRRYLAIPDTDNHIRIYDLVQGTLAGDLAGPSGGGGMLRSKALSFSPDGTELCGLFDAGRDTRLVAWNVEKPEVVVDHTFVGDPKMMTPGAFSYKGPAIEWLPDGSAWVFHGHVVFDRTGGRPVWLFRTETWFKDMGPRRMIDNDRLLIESGPDKARRLEVVVIPWKKIDAALKAQASTDVPALVKPGGEVSLKVEVGRVKHGTPESVRDDLMQVLASRLEADGIKVVDGKDTVLHVRYGEAAGETLREMRGQGGIGPFAQMTPTGRSVQATKANCSLAWQVKDGRGTKTLWTGQVDYNPTTLTIRDKEATDAAARDQMFHQLKYSLAGEPIPYFVPKDPSLAMLPGTTLLSDAPVKPTNRAVPKATTRGKSGTEPAESPRPGGSAPKAQEKKKRTRNL